MYVASYRTVGERSVMCKHSDNRDGSWQRSVTQSYLGSILKDDPIRKCVTPRMQMINERESIMLSGVLVVLFS